MNSRKMRNTDGVGVAKNIYIPRVPWFLSPRPNWDPTALSPASDCVPPGTKGGGETHLPAGEGVGGSNSDDLRKTLTVYYVVWGDCRA
jgi:hypothetical protein